MCVYTYYIYICIWRFLICFFFFSTATQITDHTLKITFFSQIIQFEIFNVFGR